MPKLILMVPDVDSGVSRHVNLAIVRQVLKLTNINELTKINYPSELEKDAQVGSRIGDDPKANLFASTERVTIDVEETYGRDRILTAAIFRPENNFIFFDNALDVYIKPCYSATDVTINVRYRSRDKVQARRWRDDIKTHISMMRDINLHTLDYHYLVPPEYMVIMKEIHRLRENVASYGEDFETYFRKYGTQRLSLLSTIAGTQEAWGISETQMRVQGYFDFDTGPEEGSRENDTDTWTINFSYHFSYDKPIACAMHYPLMIHNQPLSSKFRDSKKVYELEQHQRSYSLSVFHLGAFEKMSRIPPLAQLSGIGIPEVDDFVPGQIVPSTIRVITALVKIDETDPLRLIDFTQLGKYKIIDPIIKFMKTEAPYMTKPYESVFSVTVYRKGNALPEASVHCTNDLKVYATKELSLRDYHHVRLGLVTDLSLLSKEALDRLRLNGDILRLVLSAIDYSLYERGKLPKGDYVTRKDLNDVMYEINKIRINPDHIRQFNTVQGFYVQVNE